MRAVLLVSSLLLIALATPLSNNELRVVSRKESGGHDGHDHHDGDGHDHSSHDHDKEDKDKKKGGSGGSNSSSSASGAGTSGGDLSGVPVQAGAQGASPNNPCFPGGALVMLEDGSNVSMEKLSIGDRVAVGGGKFSEVFMFTHRLKDVIYEFVELSTDDGAKVRATTGHFMFVNGKYDTAGVIKVGDVVVREDGRRVEVNRVERVMDRGLFNPQTVHGNIIVDGVLASTYTTAVERGLAHAALAPFRAAFARLGLVCGLLESGADNIAAIVPSN